MWRRCHGTAEEKALLATWPVASLGDWVKRVNQAEKGKELEALRRGVHRGRLYGTTDWQRHIAKLLGLESVYRPVGSPRTGRNRILLSE